MFRYLFGFILFINTVFAPLSANTALALHIASFNVHYIVPGKASEDWDERKHAVVSVLKDIDADIIAFQEMETFTGGSFSPRNIQLEWIQAHLPGYQVTGAGEPSRFPNTQPVLYRPEKYTAQGQGFFFFSATPDQIYSRQWNEGYPYFCSWTRLKDRASQTEFYIFNVHNDFKSRDNRLRTSELIVDRIKRIVQKDMPVIVLGDFNAPFWFKELDILRESGLQVVPPTGSTNRIMGMSLLPAIDHVLTTPHLRSAAPVQVWNKRYGGIYPGDHYPVSVQLRAVED